MFNYTLKRLNKINYINKKFEYIHFLGFKMNGLSCQETR